MKTTKIMSANVFKKMVLLGVVLIMCLGIFTGCRDEMKPLSAAQELQIKQDYTNSFDDGMYRAIEDVAIHSYYGTYNGAIVLIISYNNTEYPHILNDETVANFTFCYHPGHVISVWKASVFYDLTQSYEQGFLTKANVESIYNLHNK